MTTRSILVAMAVSLAPLYAQQEAAPASVPTSAAQVFTALATPAAAQPAATPEQRAQVFNALALLPQDIADFAVLTQLGDNMKKLAACGKLPAMDASCLPPELLALDNAALASTQATPATYALLQHALVVLNTVADSFTLAYGWASEARQELEDTIIEELVQRADALSTLGDNATEGVHLPASYVVFTSKPGEEAVLQEAAKGILQDIQQPNRPGVTVVNDVNGFSGIHMNVVETYKAELEEATSEMAPRRKEQLLQELAKHPVHILVRQQGNALILGLCEDPQELKLAATPAESLLATDKLAACDATLNKGMIAAVHTSPQLAALGNEINIRPTLRMAEGISTVFTKLAEKEPAHKDAYEKAAAAVNLLSGELGKFIRPVTQPGTMQMWCDGDLHLSATGDAQGCSYSPGTLRLAAMADAPATTFYMESTPVHMGLAPADDKSLLEAVFSAAEGFALTLKPEKRPEAEAALQMAKAFIPDLQALAAAGCTMGSGLDGQVAFVLDAAPGMLPQFSATQPGSVHAEIPRMALYAGVKDRSKLGSGWDEALTAAGQVAAKFGLPPTIIHMLPVARTQVGSAMSYSLALPFSLQGVSPSLAVADTGVALGSSPELNTQVVESATGTAPFAGAVFALKFKPLAQTLRSLATALDPTPEEAEPVADSKVKLDIKDDELVAVVGGEDGPTTLFVQGARSDVQEMADKLSTAATIFEYISAMSEGVYGTSTIENGQSTLKVDVKLK